MSNLVKAGLVLGLLVEIWTAVVIAAGWHTNPAMMWMFFLVIPLQVVLVVMALRKQASTASFGRQVLNGVVMSVVAAVVVFVGSWLLTTVVFPDYFPQIRAAGEAMLARMGRTPDQIAEEMMKNASMYDPIANASTGAIATVLTGLVVAAIAGIFVRRKG